jgi:NitT/TauT family transport system ATP-binding protein
MQPLNPPFLSVRNLSVTFANGNGGLQALNRVSFELSRQEFVSVLGPSGSGKTTLLRVIAGLLRPTSGSFAFAAGQPRIGMVFQTANLMPWRTAIENITLPLELQGVPAVEACDRAMDLIKLVGLEGFESAWPRHLSGGMAQRVALARSLILNPDLLLLDEPFGSLDALTREKMGAELLNLWQSRRTTVLMVTHSLSEALLLSDRVLVFTPRPAQVCLDLPVDLPRPRNEDARYTPEFGQMAHTLRLAIRE